VIHFDQKYPALSVWDYFRLLTAQFVVAQWESTSCLSCLPFTAKIVL
jgi:hypothetical protein